MDWNRFLADWDKEIIPILERRDVWGPVVAPGDAEALKKKSVRFPGATDAEIAALEKRLSIKLPPSYVAFLRASNGWYQFILDGEPGKIWSTSEVRWFKEQDPQWIAAWSDPIPVSDAEYFIYGPSQDPITLRREYLPHTLAISQGVDSAVYLLNPKVIAKDGEWEAWFFGNKLPGANRYPSFAEMMQAEHDRILPSLKALL